MQKKTAFFMIIVVLLLLLVGISLAAELDFRIDWWTADGGGGKYAGGGYTLQGTIGQPEAGEAAGGDYTLSNGYWGGPLTESETPIRPINYLPLVIN